jgi:NAD(P) transhydrogenase subunit alpha
MKILLLIIIFAVTTFIGYKVIKDVPSLLHTPLMSGMNALSGITILGALISTATAVKTDNKILGVVAIVFAMINIIGGFCVTDRMLRMFKTQLEVKTK